MSTPRRPVAVLATGLLLAACSSGPSDGDEDASSRAAPRPLAAATADTRSGPSRIELVDVAAEVGLDFRHGAFHWGVTPEPAAMQGAGVCWLDYDADGWLDLFAVNSYAEREAGRWERAGELPRSALFHNVEGEFVDVSDGSGADVAMQGNGCVAADFDLDGHTDLYVTGAESGTLLWNEGDGTFTDGAEESEATAIGWYAGAAVGDVDGNGWPDLFVAGYANLGSPITGATQGFPNTYTGVRDLLYLNQGHADGGRVTFREVGMQAGLEVANFEYGLGALFSDPDGDGDLDLYVANDTKPDRLYDNVPWPGGAKADPAGLGFRFEELAARAGVADPGAGMGVAGADYDADGREDLFVTNARGQVHGVFHGEVSEQVDPSFADVRDDLGIDLGAATGWGVSWGDLDLDTDLDLVVANGDIPVTDLAGDAEALQVFDSLEAQRSAAAYEAVGPEAGLADVGPLLARGSATADFDNDGDLDVAVGTIGGPLVLLENRAASGNWLEVALDGFFPGAVITVSLADGRELTREVQAGSSYLSSEDPRGHFGLGDSAEVSQLVVRWPGGGETTLDDVAANQVVVVEPPG
ncbi:MAG TPA: CRTAC1 family protein [Acidimicrobiales bacterium]|nr:CRTAC1 family protein [Acidimicrobiales bacterium]